MIPVENDEMLKWKLEEKEVEMDIRDMAIYGTPKSTTRNHHHKHGKCNSSHHHGIKEGCKGTHRHCSHGHKCHHKHHHHHYRESSKSETLASSVEGKHPFIHIRRFL